MDFQDGQTMVLNGTTYVRQGGMWHPQANAGPVYGAPPKVEPYAAEDQQLQRDNAARSARADQRAADAADRQTREWNATHNPDGTTKIDAPTINASAVNGKDYLKTIDPATGAMVKALAEGRKAFPSGTALKSPYWQEMLSHVSNYDPGFDEVNYTSRAGTRRDFTSGKAANNIRALNTAIGHLGHLNEQIDGTASHGFVPLNVVENAGRRMFGDAGPTNFDATVSALAGELTSVYRGSGGAEADIQRYIDQMSPNASREQKVGTIRNIVGLLKSRLDALNDQYRQGMGTTAQQLQLLDPQAQLIVNHLGGFDEAGAPQGPSGGAPAAPPMNGGGGGSPPPPDLPPDAMTGATGSTKEVVDPNLTPVRREYMARLDAGQSASELVSFLRKAGVTDPALLRAAVDQAKFHRQNPNVPVGKYDTSAIDHMTQQMGVVNQGMNAAGQSGLGAGVAAAGNAVTGGFLPEVVGVTGGNAEQARLALQYSGQDHPEAALAGGIVGGTTAALGGEAALARGGMEAGFARSLAADTGYGAAAGAGASPDNRLEGAALGAVAGAAGSAGGQALAGGAGNVVRGVANADVGVLSREGVPLTIGQAVGGRTKALEDKLTSYVGSINARRGEGVRVFNSKTFDRALEPIGQKVGGLAGEDAIATARTKVSDAFSSALKGKEAHPDPTFIANAGSALRRLSAIKRNDLGPEIVGQIEEATKDLFDPSTGSLSGENMQTFLEALRQIRQSYASDPLAKRVIAPSIKNIEQAVEGMFERQAPEVMPAYNSAKAAYRRVSTLSDAVNAGKNTDGIFTPAQLGTADRGNAKKFDGAMNAASGSAPFHDYQRAAQNTLPSKIPDSGTAGRAALMAIPGALASGGAGIGYLAGDTKSGSEVGIGLATLLTALYSRGGQRLLVNAAVKRGPKARAAGEALRGLAPYAGGVGAALTQTSGGQ